MVIFRDGIILFLAVLSATTLLAEEKVIRLELAELRKEPSDNWIPDQSSALDRAKLETLGFELESLEIQVKVGETFRSKFRSGKRSIFVSGQLTKEPDRPEFLLTIKAVEKIRTGDRIPLVSGGFQEVVDEANADTVVRLIETETVLISGFEVRNQNDQSGKVSSSYRHRLLVATLADEMTEE